MTRFPIIAVNIICIAFFAVLMSPVGIASDDGPMTHNTAVLAATLSKLNLTNPIRDLNKNLKHQDRRFIGIYGVSCDTPGVSEGDRKYVRLPGYGRRCLDGTTDVVENDKHMGMIDEATKYATIYNKELLQRIRRHDSSLNTSGPTS